MNIDLAFDSPQSRRHVASRLANAEAPELKLIALQALDHAHKISAEMIENRAQADAAIAQLAGLKNEIRELTELLEEIAPNWKSIRK